MKSFGTLLKTSRIVLPVVMAGAVLSGTAATASAAAGCSVTYTVTNQWQGGFGADVKITNLGDPLDGWRLTWSWPAAGQSVTQMWNATYSGSGANATATNVSWNASIPAGGSTSFGFNGAWSTANPSPTSFALNGVTCSGQVSPTTAPVTAPPTTTSPPRTTAPVTTRATTPPATTAPPTRDLTVPGNLGTHDPSRIINDGGSYYFYSTGGGIPGWYTTDGRNWKQTPAILPNGIPSTVHNAVPTNDGRDVWAPDIIWNPNTRLFNLYYAVADWDNDTRSAIGLVTSPTLNPNASNYRWTDRGVVIAKTPTANTYNAIDPAPFFDNSGNMWMSFGSGYASTRNTAINIVALDKFTGLRSDNSVHTVQGCGCEASYVQYHSGYYYLFWNTGGCCSGASSTYLIHVARSTSVTGPYSGTRNFYASTGSVHGPGQIGVLSQNGQDHYSYHYYPNSGGSVMGYGVLNWSDGWPVR